MSHHYSGPDASFPHGDARLDLTDLYAFPKPGSTAKSILIMNVHPSSGINPPGPTRQDPFASDALYELKIDTDGDAVADIAYRVRFSPFLGGAQTATLRRVEGAQAAGTGDGGQTIVEHAPVSNHDDPRGFAHLVERHDLRRQLRADAGGIAHGECNDGPFQSPSPQGLPSARRGIHVVIAGK